MKGSTKQVAWATQIVARYQAAREVIVGKAEALPEANKSKILAALEVIDSKITKNESAEDVIARGGYAYLNTDVLTDNTAAIMDVVRDIASGNDSALVS